MSLEEQGLVMDVISSPEQLGRLLDQVFAVPAGMHFLEDFPVWDGRVGPGPEQVLRAGAFKGEQLVSSACVRLARLKTAAGNSLAVGIVGGVATDPQFRGRGLASAVVSLGVRWAEERGAALMLLWGSEHSLYRKQGFEPCGSQVRLPLSSFNFDSAAEQVQEGWRPSLFPQIKSREGGLLLEDRDQSWYSAHRNVRWFWIGDPQRPAAYAALGRGIDLSGMVHEWGGDRLGLMKIFGHIKGLEPQATLLGGPSVLKKYGFVYDESPSECLCLAKVSKPEVVFEAFVPGERLDQYLEPQWLATLSPPELSRLFFGPLETPILPFPLPLWVWGLDAA